MYDDYNLTGKAGKPVVGSFWKGGFSLVLLLVALVAYVLYRAFWRG